MKNFNKYLLGSLALLFACHDNEFKLADTGKDYFPLQTGAYQIYTVEEVIYSELNPVQTHAYQLKVEVVDSFPNLEGSYTFVMNRSRRTDEGEAWTDISTWSARSNDRELVVSEGNIPFVKLSFPMKTGSEWNGNKFNSLAEDDYDVTAFDQPATVGGMTFEKTLTVIEENNEDFIFFLDERKGVYARGVGLISYELTQLSYCTDDNCRGQQKIKSGTIYKQEISEFGKH